MKPLTCFWENYQKRMMHFSASSSRFFEKKVAQGIALSDFFGSLLYHTKNYQGTTTTVPLTVMWAILYHTKNYQGTTTCLYSSCSCFSLYHTKNYQGTTTIVAMFTAFSLLYHTKNYQGTTTSCTSAERLLNYTIPRTTRELQHHNLR